MHVCVRGQTKRRRGRSCSIQVIEQKREGRHDGTNEAQARQELQQMIARTIPLFPFQVRPDWNSNSTIIPLQESLTGEMRGKLMLLLYAVGCVLLIACANVASLMLARVAARQREMAVRAALGAGRGRIVRQLLTESVMLALTGAGLGLILAMSGLSALKSAFLADNPMLDAAGIDWQVFTFVAGLAVLTGLTFGLAPALGASRLDLAASLKARGRQCGGLIGARLRSSLIVSEVALAVALVISAGLLIKSLWLLTHDDPGFSSERVLTVRVYPQMKGEKPAAYIALYDELLRRARGMTGVGAVAAANATPLGGELPALPVELEGEPFVSGQSVAPMLWAGAVTPGYFDLLGVRLLGGRSFTEADGEKSEGVLIVSAETARRYWPGESAVGKRIRIVWENRWRTVVGVVGDVRQYDLAGKTPEWISGAFYMPYAQATALDRRIPAAMTLILRAAADSPALAGEIRRLVAGVNPDIPVGDIRTLQSEVNRSALPSLSLMWLFIAFGGSALLLATIGAYGVVSYSASQRTYEMGVRIALGAAPGRIFGLVMGQSLRLVTAGLALGMPASLVLARLMTGFLYGVTATDPATFLAVGILMIAVALMAGFLPARRASSVDPLVALRHE
ncbi:MAG: ABC transporter permease [Blastocatellales bacterium]|nr:ABC transporter permease [Blastocatellales bacterium]